MRKDLVTKLSVMAATLALATTAITPAISASADTNTQMSTSTVPQGGDSQETSTSSQSGSSQPTLATPQGDASSQSGNSTATLQSGQYSDGQVLTSSQATELASSGAVLATHHFHITKEQVSQVVNLGVQLGIDYLTKKHPKMATAIAADVAGAIVSVMGSGSLDVTTMDLQTISGGVTTVVKRLSWN